jgi:hypothetical protein
VLVVQTQYKQAIESGLQANWVVASNESVFNDLRGHRKARSEAVTRRQSI